ncbi:MAG TPA: hypothetical protein DCM28_20985 [Phycisphaerales bacterium]|nr:hypothetical protein [Phycisphaerales bacterium]HCD32412.1 hypothetical protein [Phycisphaerales bacterium]|tara:strand:+ start:237 stop:539 length:303 start_codon:yes stop_codon:yes gene_type:complete
MTSTKTDSTKQHTEHLLKSYLKTLRMPTMHRESSTVELYLQQLAELEVAQRKAGAIARRLKHAQFPVTKEISDFDFAAVPKLNKKRLIDLAQCDFVPTFS